MSHVEIERPMIRARIGRQRLKPKKYSNYLNPAAAAQEARIAEKKRNRELYGDALEDVDFLRRCGWAINLTCDGRVKFGNQLLTLGVSCARKPSVSDGCVSRRRRRSGRRGCRHDPLALPANVRFLGARRPWLGVVTA